MGAWGNPPKRNDLRFGMGAYEKQRRDVLVAMLALLSFSEWWASERYGFSEPFTDELVANGAPKE